MAIMGILATVIGGLVTSGTTAYMRQKEMAAAKDIATIVQNEIKQTLLTSILVFLQDDSELASSNNFIEVDGLTKNFDMLNAPSGNFRMFASNESGQLIYSENSGLDSEEYFTSSASEVRAFYGSHKLSVYFRPLINSFKEITSIKVFCDVYDKNDKIKYDSPGLEVDLIEARYLPGKNEENIFVGVFSFQEGNMSAITTDGDYYKYNNMLLTESYTSVNPKGFTNIFFRTVD